MVGIHQNNFTRVPDVAILDQALSALLNDLSNRGMLDNLSCSRFRIAEPNNQCKRRTRPLSTFSCMLAGGGIRRSDMGKTDVEGREVIEQKVEIPDFNATIAYALGLPLDQIIYSPTRRPFTLSDKGNPLVELI